MRYLTKPHAFRTALIGMGLLVVVLSVHAVWRLTDHGRVLSWLMAASPTAGPTPGSLVTVEGTPRPLPLGQTRLASDHLVTLLRPRLEGRPLLFATARLVHTEGSGEDATTVTDRVAEAFFPFTVTPDTLPPTVSGFGITAEAPTFRVAAHPDWWIFPTSLRLDLCRFPLSPNSTEAEVEMFAPDRVGVLGTIAGTASDPMPRLHPVLVTHLPFDRLKGWLIGVCLAHAAVLAALAWFLAFSPNPLFPDRDRLLPLRERYESERRRYFVFEITRGPESWLIWGFLLTAVGGGAGYWLWPFASPFHRDLLTAGLGLLSLLLIWMGHRTECFLVADRETGRLVLVTRGFGAITQSEVCPLAGLRVTLESTTDGDGDVTWHLQGNRTPGAPVILSDPGCEADLRLILRAWGSFARDLPAAADGRG